jgi:diguanylate cyclase (GGDEF)-like protein
MAVRSIVVLDIPDDSASRRILETVEGCGMAGTEVDTLEAFCAALASRRSRVGIIAFEALRPDPQKALRMLRDHAPGARILVAHEDKSSRLRLGQRLWSVGLCDYFLPRSSPPHELAPVLRQAYADALIEAAVEMVAGDEDPVMGKLHGRLRFLHNLNAALTNQRRVDGLVRELQMKLSQLLDFTILQVLITRADGPQLYVFQARPIEHQLVWKLAEDLCVAVTPFIDAPLSPELLEFVEGAPLARADDEVAIAAFDERSEVTIPMVFCGELVGGIAVAAQSEVTPEHRAILQLVAYQLASSIRNAQALEAAESDSMVDELTGASNRRYMKRALTAEWRRAERYKSPLSVAMIDIDHFKRINDTHGHLVGDAVLHGVVALLRAQLRDTDHLIRYGGEEFLLLLPETSLRDAALVLERIRFTLARTPVYTSDKTGPLQITISAGGAGYPICSAAASEELVHLADEALLMAKRSGRDRVCLASADGFESLSNEQQIQHEKRQFARIRSQVPVRFVELPEFEARVSELSATDVSAGGIALAGSPATLKKNAYALVYLGDEQKPRLTQVRWTRDAAGDTRAAGLAFVEPSKLPRSEGADVQRLRAIVLAQDPQTNATIQRVMSAARYQVTMLHSADDVKREDLESCSLLVIGSSSLRGELGERIKHLRERDEGPRLRIALLNEAYDRRGALDTLRTQHVDHLLSGGPADDTLFATVSKLVLGEYFGLKKYLYWGAETRSWSITSSSEKGYVLDAVKAQALEVSCHPRITDLLVAAVDEMVINALYRPRPDADDSTRRPVTVECGSDGRFLGVAVIDEHGLFCHQDLFHGIGKALEREEKGLPETAPQAHLGFRIMLSTLSHLVINVDPGSCTEIIGLVDLRKSLKEHRRSVPSLGMFTNQRDK